VIVRGGVTGGPNLEFALTLAVEFDGVPGVAISVDTDPNDGPSDAASGIVDGGTERKTRKRGMDPRGPLRTATLTPLWKPEWHWW
jgi:glycerate 2-kinase